MAQGVLSQSIKLSYKTSSATTYSDLNDLQSIPAIGKKKDSIEITTLADTAHTFMPGLDSGDELNFVFLLRPDSTNNQYEILDALTGDIDWKVTFPTSTGLEATFKGACSVQMDAAGANAALTYTLSIKPSSAITIA